MKVKLKRSVLANVLKHLIERQDRSDLSFNATQSNFGNGKKMYGGFQQDDDDLPVSPKPHMSVQLSVAEPPVADPEYVPASKAELKNAAVRIAEEVPQDQIELFYRLLHKALDVAIDEVDDGLFRPMINESYVSLDLQDRRTARVLAKAINILDSTQQSPEDVASRVMNQLKLSDPSMYEQVLLYLQQNMKPRVDLSDPDEDEYEVDVSDVFVAPPEEMKDLSPSNVQQKRRVITRKEAEVAPKRKKREKVIIDEEEYTHMAAMLDASLATARSDQNKMDEYAKDWKFEKAKKRWLLQLMFDISFILHELSYQIMQAEYYNTYGGYVYDPDAVTSKGKKGAYVLIKDGPQSRSWHASKKKLIKKEYGLTYENMLHQRNVVKLSKTELETVLNNAIRPILVKNPQLYNVIKEKTDDDQDAENTIKFIARVLAAKYRQEAALLDKDLIKISIEGMLQKALFGLPDEYGLQPMAAVSLDAIGRKKDLQNKKIKRRGKVDVSQKAIVKKFDKMSKDPKLAKQFIKLLPPLLLGVLPETKAAIVKIEKNNYTFTDKDTGLQDQNSPITKAKLLKRIKEYVKSRVEGKVNNMFDVPELSDVEAEEIEKSTNDIQGLPADEVALQKYVNNLNKMISGAEFDLTSPLFGFSSASGIRQWYLKFPDRKLRIILDARRGVKGAKEFMSAMDNANINIAASLSTEDGPGIIRMLQNENYRKKKGRTEKDESELKLLAIIEEDIEMINDLLSNTRNIALTKSSAEYQKLMQSPGGKIFRNVTGLSFNNVITRSDKPWQEALTKMLTKAGVTPVSEARKLQQHLTGLKEIPDFENNGETAKVFLKHGIDEKRFAQLQNQAVQWFYDHLAENVKSGKPYEQILSKTKPLYKYDPKTDEFKLNPGGEKQLRQIMEKVIDEYLDVKAISGYQEKARKQIEKVQAEYPNITVKDINESKLDKILELYI